MNITFSLNSNPALFWAFHRAIEHICGDDYHTRSEDKVIDLLQQKCGVRLIRAGVDHVGTIWTAHFVDDITYAWFILRWS